LEHNVWKKMLCYATSRGEWPSKQNTLIAETILDEPRPQPGFDVWGQNAFLGGKDFCFHHIFKTIFSEHNNVWGGTKIFGGNCLPMPHRVCGPGQSRHQKVFHCGPSCLCRGARHSENLFLIPNMKSVCRLCELIISIFPQIPIIGS